MFLQKLMFSHVGPNPHVVLVNKNRLVVYCRESTLVIYEAIIGKLTVINPKQSFYQYANDLLGSQSSFMIHNSSKMRRHGVHSQNRRKLQTHFQPLRKHNLLWPEHL